MPRFRISAPDSSWVGFSRNASKTRSVCKDIRTLPSGLLILESLYRVWHDCKQDSCAGIGGLYRRVRRLRGTIRHQGLCMNVDGHHYRTIWLSDDRATVQVIDQRRLPHEFITRQLRTVNDAVEAIANMTVRGAPLIGATAAFGVALGLRADPSDRGLQSAVTALINSRPTAVNLAWAARAVAGAVKPLPFANRFAAALKEAQLICEDDVASCLRIGEHGADVMA